jgi:hypothetical protein
VTSTSLRRNGFAIHERIEVGSAAYGVSGAMPETSPRAFS